MGVPPSHNLAPLSSAAGRSRKQKSSPGWESAFSPRQKLCGRSDLDVEDRSRRNQVIIIRYEDASRGCAERRKFAVIRIFNIQELSWRDLLCVLGLLPEQRSKRLPGQPGDLPHDPFRLPSGGLIPYQLEAPLLYPTYNLRGTAAPIEPGGDEDIRVQHDSGTWHVLTPWPLARSFGAAC